MTKLFDDFMQGINEIRLHERGEISLRVDKIEVPMTLQEAIEIISRRRLDEISRKESDAIEIIEQSFDKILTISEELAHRKMSVYAGSSDMLKSNHQGICEIYSIVKGE